jgi:hypothetical protein
MKKPLLTLVPIVCVAGWFGCGGHGVMAATNQLPVAPPLPIWHSPVDSFRRLLVMPNAERKAYLETRNADFRNRVVEKIREYQKLTPEERELKLRATELRWYLEPLLKIAPTNRPAAVATIPVGIREMVAARLQQWDRLSPTVQQSLLTNQHGATYIASVTTSANSPSAPVEAMRRAMAARFNRLFDLTPAEKQTVLASLSEAERRQMEKTLEKFQQLPSAQRRVCILSFQKFVGMNADERQDFLKNAHRWSQMSPSERQAWRELVSAAPNLPPLPIVAAPRPPIPVHSRQLPGPLTTNGG